MEGDMIIFNSLPVVPFSIPNGGHFGPRNTGIQGASTNHLGVDMRPDPSRRQDTPVLSVADGEVLQSYFNSARGFVVVIRHNGFDTLYQHLAVRSPLPIGRRVLSGERIGTMGSTGIGSGIHLHFELIVNGVRINPINNLNNIGKEIAMNYEDYLVFFDRALAERGMLPVNPAIAPAEFAEAIGAGITDGTRPMSLGTRQEMGVMCVRVVRHIIQMIKEGGILNE